MKYCCAADPDVLSAVVRWQFIPFPPSLLLFHTLPMSSLKDPLLPTEEKVAPAPSAQPPSYQVAAEAPAPPAPGPPEHDEHGHPKRCRRRCRRFGHFLAAAFLLWLAARFLVRHCELRRMGPPHHPGHFPWVRHPLLVVFLCLPSLTDTTLLPSFLRVLAGVITRDIITIIPLAKSIPALIPPIGPSLILASGISPIGPTCGGARNSRCRAPAMTSFCSPRGSMR
jgi:hypothetical protein